ncbi:MAG: DUF1489 family protein [Pseudomonadota bacterium]
MPLHLTKVAFGIDSLDQLRERIALREAQGGFFLTTRYLPKRHAEIAGGSLYWILRHQLVARTPILGFGAAEGGKTTIQCAADLVLVRAAPRRAHQGWRYLEDKDAPPDLDGEAGGVGELPPDLAGRLAELALI